MAWPRNQGIFNITRRQAQVSPTPLQALHGPRPPSASHKEAVPPKTEVFGLRLSPISGSQLWADKLRYGVLPWVVYESHSVINHL